MSDYNIDRDIYELEEAGLKADLAMKEIDAKYKIKHMVLESSGQLTPEEFLALEEKDNDQKSEDKKGVLQKLIKTILEKIRNFLNMFKKDKTKWEDIKPDTEIETPVSEEDLRKYIKNGEVIREKLDKVLETAQGSSMEDYQNAMREYEEASKDNAFMDSITSELVGNDIDNDTKKNVKRFMVKAGTITAAIAVAKKLGEGFDAILSLLNDTIPGETGKLFAKMKIDKDTALEQSNHLTHAMQSGSQRVGSFRRVTETAYKNISKNISKSRESKNYEATRKELFDQEDNVKGKADMKKTAFASHNNDDTILGWIDGPLHGDLNSIIDRGESRPKFKDIGALEPYVFKDKNIMTRQDLNKTLTDLLNPANVHDTTLDKCYETFKRRVSGDKDAKPIFFDLWGICFRKFMKVFGDYDGYLQLQRNLFKLCNMYRKAIKKREIAWNENLAKDYLKIITTGDKNELNGNSWEHYIEDQGHSKKSSTSSGSTSSSTAGAEDFLNKCYKTMSYEALFGSDGSGKKDGKLVSLKAEDNHYWGFSLQEVQLFANDRFKDKSMDSFADVINYFKMHNEDIGTDRQAIIDIAKKWCIRGNIMRWTKTNMEKFKDEANRTHRGAGDAFLRTLDAAGWTPKYFIS